MSRVFVNGCFDILHRGHIELLQAASSQGDILLVAIDSDKRVSELKGPSRPINTEKDRKFLLESLKMVKQVKIFDSEEELLSIVKDFKPDVMMVGSDYRNKAVIGASHAKKLLYFQRIDEYSTTKTIQNISNR